MFRSALLASVGMLALSAAARAQMAVFDGANFANTARSVVQGAQQVQQLTQQLATLQQQYSQLVQTYQAISHLPQQELAQLGQQLNVSEFRTPLPTTSGTIGNVLGGTGLSSLGSLGQQYLNQNRVYAPAGSDFQARQMTGTASSVAGVQAMLDQLYQSATGHITTLQGLEGQLAGVPDEKAVADISARVQTEQTYLAAQQIQAQTIQTWQAAQVRNEEEQHQEKRRQDIDDVLNKLNAGS
jgi:type IV secretion system protein VirB5